MIRAVIAAIFALACGTASARQRGEAPPYALRTDAATLLREALAAYAPNELRVYLYVQSGRGLVFQIGSMAFSLVGEEATWAVQPTQASVQLTLEHHRQQVRLDHEDWNVRLEYASALQSVQHSAEAIDQYIAAAVLLGTARELDPGNCELALEHAECLLELRRDHEARAILRAIPDGPCSLQAALRLLDFDLEVQMLGFARNPVSSHAQLLADMRDLEQRALERAGPDYRAELRRSFLEKRPYRLMLWLLSRGMSQLPSPRNMLAALEQCSLDLQAQADDTQVSRLERIERMRTELLLGICTQLIRSRAEVLERIEALSGNDEEGILEAARRLLRRALPLDRPGIEPSAPGPAWSGLDSIGRAWCEANAVRIAAISAALEAPGHAQTAGLDELQLAVILDMLDDGTRYARLQTTAAMPEVFSGDDAHGKGLLLAGLLAASGRLEECAQVLSIWQKLGRTQERVLEACMAVADAAADLDATTGNSAHQTRRLKFGSSATLLGAFHLLEDRFTQAVESLREGVMLDEQLAAGWQLLGFALLRSGQPRLEAERAFERGSKFDDVGAPRSRAGLALTAAAGGAELRARTFALEAALLAPSDSIVRVVEAVLLERQILEQLDAGITDRFNLATDCMRACSAVLRACLEDGSFESDSGVWSGKLAGELAVVVARSLLAHEPQPPAEEREARRQRALLLELLNECFTMTGEKEFALLTLQDSLSMFRELAREGGATAAECRTLSRMELRLGEGDALARERAAEALRRAMTVSRDADPRDFLDQARLALEERSMDEALKALELCLAASRQAEVGAGALLQGLSMLGVVVEFDRTLDTWIAVFARYRCDEFQYESLRGRAEALLRTQLEARPDSAWPLVSLARLLQSRSSDEERMRAARELLEQALDLAWFPSNEHRIGLVQAAFHDQDFDSAMHHGRALLREDALADQERFRPLSADFDAVHLLGSLHELCIAVARPERLAEVLAAGTRWSEGDPDRLLLLGKSTLQRERELGNPCSCGLGWLEQSAQAGPRDALLAWIDACRVQVGTGSDASMLDAPIAHLSALRFDDDPELTEQLGLALWLRGERCGSRPDLIAGHERLLQASEANMSRSLVHFARLYRRGEYVERNRELALAFYRDAAQLDDPYAALELGTWLILEPTRDTDVLLGRSWVERTAEMNFMPAMEILIELCEKGVGGPVDLERAQELRAILEAERKDRAAGDER